MPGTVRLPEFIVEIVAGTKALGFLVFLDKSVGFLSRLSKF
jgi:hypothetical protein